MPPYLVNEEVNVRSLKKLFKVNLLSRGDDSGVRTHVAGVKSLFPNLLEDVAIYYHGGAAFPTSQVLEYASAIGAFSILVILVPT